MSISLKLLNKLRCRLLEKGTGQPVPAVVVHLSILIDGDTKISLPVSTLRTDATGYVSFDLLPLTDLGLDIVPEVHVSAPQVGLKNHDVLQQLKGAAGSDAPRTSFLSFEAQGDGQKRRPVCMEFSVYVDRPNSGQGDSEALCRTVHLVSVQRPDLCDYQLSPYSFVTPVKINVGGECCESLAPSTLPVEEHSFYRVVVWRKASDESVESLKVKLVQVGDAKRMTPQPELRFAEVLDFRQRWYAIGHSLGEIKYSLPLAPGESTQLAVIEWSRTDAASRFDSVTANENLTHWQNRDRTIHETINAGLKETQSGWSWAGGLSSGMAYDAKAYGQYTGNWAAGGGTSSTNGTRDVVGESQQELDDTIKQSTGYIRSLNSTVIVQASQAEANTVRTRRVANHNHCHALTIQYYEVLRHFRLETAFVGRRFAVLIPFSTFEFDRAKATRFRYALEQALIDRSLLSYFDALVRLKLDLYESVAVTAESKYFVGSLAGLLVDAANFPMFPMSNGKRLLVEKGSTLHITAQKVGNIINFGGGSAGNADVDGQPGRPAPPDQNWPLPGAPSFAFLAKVGPKLYLVQRDSTFEAQEEGELSLWFNDAAPLSDNSGFATATVSVTAPAKAAAPDTEKIPVDSLSLKDADTMKAAFLLDHLNANEVYYNRAVWMLMDVAERRLRLEAALGSDSPILAAMDDKPIAVSGNYVAFSYDGPLPFKKGSTVETEPLESIVTLPTRGLFAEAQLGHCNSCEKRDVTRMWDWTEMTTEEPPAITGIEPGPRGQTPSITPAQLPANVIQIAPTPAAPDPAGLAAALRLLGTPNIFRDMSGLDEASMILGKLVDGTTTTLTEMVRGAAAAKQKVDSARAQQNTGSTGQSSQQTPAERYDNLQVAKQVAQAADQLGLSDQQKSALAQNILGGSGSGGGGGGGGGGLLDEFLNTATGAVPGAPKLAVAKETDPSRRLCCALGQWKVGGSGALDPLAIGGHKKGGIFPGGTTGYVYSKRIGLLDLGHLRDLADLTKFIYDGLVRGAVTFNLFEGTASVFRIPPDQESRLAVAGAIAYVESWAHEIATWPDRSSFSPEDLCSNIVGIECAKRAIRVGGSYDAAMDTVLYALMNAELDAASMTETADVLRKIDGDWFDITNQPEILLRRNFDGVPPWMASMTFDAPGAPLAPAWLDPSTFAPLYSEFSYMMGTLVAGKIVMLANMKTTTDGLKTAFVAAHPGKDRPA